MIFELLQLGQVWLAEGQASVSTNSEREPLCRSEATILRQVLMAKSKVLNDATPDSTSCSYFLSNFVNFVLLIG